MRVLFTGQTGLDKKGAIRRLVETGEIVARQLPARIEHYNQEAPHSALGMCTPSEFYAAWAVNNGKVPVQI